MSKKITYCSEIQEFLIPWEKQRLIDSYRVDQIVSDVYIHHKKTGKWGMNLWVISTCKWNKIYYIIDGQHRYEAYKKLSQLYQNVPDVQVLVEDIKNESEIEEYFIICNKAVPIEYPFNKGTIKEVKEVIEEGLVKFKQSRGLNKLGKNRKNIFKDSEHPHKPHLSQNMMKTFFYKKKCHKKFKSSDEFWNHLELFNSWIKEKVNETDSKAYDKSEENNCYIGMFPIKGKIKDWRDYYVDFSVEIDDISSEVKSLSPTESKEMAKKEDKETKIKKEEKDTRIKDKKEQETKTKKEEKETKIKEEKEKEETKTKKEEKELKTIKEFLSTIQLEQEVKTRKRGETAIRNGVWEIYISKESMNGKCYLCKDEIKHKSKGWECGHIIAKRDKGPYNIHNLRPICGSCNSSMGKNDMLSFTRNMINAGFKKFEYGRENFLKEGIDIMKEERD